MTATLNRQTEVPTHQTTKVTGDVITNFAKRELNRYGWCVWRSRYLNGESGRFGSWSGGFQGHSLQCDEKALYSFGTRFVLAVYLGQRGDETPLFIKNGDRFSTMTGQHQGDVQRACSGPTVSAGALEVAGIRLKDLTLDNIVDYWEDSHTQILRDKDGKLYKEVYKPEIDEAWRKAWADRCEAAGLGEAVPYPTATDPETHAAQKADWELWVQRRNELMSPQPNSYFLEPYPEPEQGMFIGWGTEAEVTRRWDTNGVEIVQNGVWHVLGSCLIEWKGQHLLCSLDEGSYFVSLLPTKVRTVREAFDLLKPEAAKMAEAEGKDVKRQGEWFFIPTGMGDREFAKAMGFKSIKEMKGRLSLGSTGNYLPLQNSSSNRHNCTYFVKDGRTYARGKVYHRDRWGDLSGEHKTLSLGDVWHEVHRNTELASYTGPKDQGRGRYD